jgi:hypothetical protein
MEIVYIVNNTEQRLSARKVNLNKTDIINEIQNVQSEDFMVEIYNPNISIPEHLKDIAQRTPPFVLWGKGDFLSLVNEDNSMQYRGRVYIPNAMPDYEIASHLNRIANILSNNQLCVDGLEKSLRRFGMWTHPTFTYNFADNVLDFVRENFEPNATDASIED